MREFGNYNKHNTESIYEQMDISDYFKLQKEHEDDLFNSFKKAKKDFIIYTIISVLLFYFCFFLFINSELFEGGILLFLSILMLGISIAFPIRAFKQFKYQALRYEFRMKALIEKLSNHGVNISLAQEDVKDPVDRAYASYGIKTKHIVLAAIATVLITAALSGLMHWNQVFTFEKWAKIDKRPSIVSGLSDINSWLEGSNERHREEKFNFNNKSLDEIHKLLGEPEISIVQNKEGIDVKTHSTYKSYMENPTTYNWDFEIIPEIYYECYYVGNTTWITGDEWFAMFWIDGKLKLCSIKEGECIYNFEDYDIDRLKSQ